MSTGPGRFQVHYFHNATLGRRDFYRQRCWGLGLTPSATAAALFRAVSQHIEELAAENRGHPVFVFDEAHLLQDATVEILHLLLNYEWDSPPLPQGSLGIEFPCTVHRQKDVLLQGIVLEGHEVAVGAEDAAWPAARP